MAPQANQLQTGVKLFQEEGCYPLTRQEKVKIWLFVLAGQLILGALINLVVS
jgi:hypothetical protein